MQRILRFAGKATQIFTAALLAFLLVCNLYLIVMSRVLGTEDPTIFGYSAALVASGSMEPALSVDDLILNHAQTSYAEGDIITFRSGDSLTTHRIVAVTEDGYITQGDANNAADPDSVSSDAVVGRVVSILPRIGSAIVFLNTPLGMTALVFATLLIAELPFFLPRQKNSMEGDSNEA